MSLIGRLGLNGGVLGRLQPFIYAPRPRSHSLDSNDEHLSRIQHILSLLQSTSSRILNEGHPVVKRAIHPGVINEICHPRFVLDRSTTHNEAQPEEPRPSGGNSQPDLVQIANPPLASHCPLQCVLQSDSPIHDVLHHKMRAQDQTTAPGRQRQHPLL